jgi:hypothetical protein
LRNCIIILAALSCPAAADEPAGVRLPDLSEIEAAGNSADLMMELAQAEVVGMNCKDYLLSRAEVDLVSGTVKLLADYFDLNPEFRFSTVYGDASASLADPGTCDREGPKIAPLLDRLRAMGASTGPGD